MTAAGADHRGSRQLGAVEQSTWYLLAGGSYIVLSLWHKWLLNWFVGPAWLVAIVVLGPWLLDHLTGRQPGAGPDRPP